jgi:hypothetical protein
MSTIFTATPSFFCLHYCYNITSFKHCQSKQPKDNDLTNAINLTMELSF